MTIMTLTIPSALLCIAMSPPGGAPCDDVFFHSSFGDWMRVVSSAELKVTFDEPVWPINQVLAGQWTVNGVMFVGLAGAPQPNIFVASFGSPFGSGHWLVANGDENIDFTPSIPTTAIAFDAASNRLGPAFVKVYAGNDALIGSLTIATAEVRFVGITSGVPISRVNFSSTLGAFADTGFDNVRLASYDISVDPDLNDDGFVNGADLTVLLGEWGACPPQESGECCPADLDGDGTVGGGDITVVLGAWTG